MATEKQIAANRQNAQHSTGPRTAQGKAIVARNAIKHGLFTEKALIDEEDPAEFRRHRTAMLAGLQPAAPMESFLAERIVALSWRLLRTGRLQAEAFYFLKPHRHWKWPKDVPLPDLSEIDLPRTPFAEHAISDFKQQHVLERLLTYECKMEKSLYKAYLQFERLQMHRLHAAANAPDESPVAEEPSDDQEPTAAEDPTIDEDSADEEPANEDAADEDSANEETPTQEPADQKPLDEAPAEKKPFRENKPILNNSLLLEMLANSKFRTRY